MADDRPELILAHSPDADDMVMWWPLVGMRDASGEALPGEAGRPAVDTGRFRFRCLPEDVEALNRAAADEGAPFDITAISAASYPKLKERWAITSCGGSFGEGYGPKLVTHAGRQLEIDDLVESDCALAIPGLGTTAYLTLRLLLGSEAAARLKPVEMPFSEIAGAVHSGAMDAGLLIHEAQWRPADLGLRVVVDLGAWWAERHRLPLPLGLNVIRRDLAERFGPDALREVGGILGQSVQHAVRHADESRRYLELHADSRPEWRNPELVATYLSWYVNDRTIDMGPKGRESLAVLLGMGYAAGLCGDPEPLDIVRG